MQGTVKLRSGDPLRCGLDQLACRRFATLGVRVCFDQKIQQSGNEALCQKRLGQSAWPGGPGDERVGVASEVLAFRDPLAKGRVVSGGQRVRALQPGPNGTGLGAQGQAVHLKQ